MSNKTWIICGLFEDYDQAKEKIIELDDEFELYKIKRVREKSKKGLFKLKAWKEPPKKQTKKKSKKSNKNKEENVN